MKHTNKLSLFAFTFAAITSFTSHAATPAYPGSTGVPFQSIQTQVDALKAELNTFKAQVNAQIAVINQQIADLEQTTGDHTTMINMLQGQLNTLQAQLVDVENALAGKQEIISGTCDEGSSIRAVYANGTVECETDTGHNIVRVEKNAKLILPYEAISVDCPSGYVATGGGFYGLGVLTSLNGSLPLPDGTGWHVGVTYYASPIPMDFLVYVNCTAQ